MKTALLLALLLLPILLIAVDYQVGDHELLLMPTAYVMPKGDAYFTDYELFLLNYVYSVGYNTHLAAFTMFPATKGFFETTSLGIKHNYFQNEYLASSLHTSYTPRAQLFLIGNVVSIGKSISNSGHVSLMWATNGEESANDVVILTGYRYDVTQNVSLMIEYANAVTASDYSFDGLLTLGLRVRSGQMAWEIGGFRPLENTGDLLILPLLKATYYFKK